MDTVLEILKNTAIVSAGIFGTFVVVLLLTKILCKLFPEICEDEEEEGKDEGSPMAPWY